MVFFLAATSMLAAPSLPTQYFRLMEGGIAPVEERLNADPNVDLAALEARPDWRHFPYAILAPAVLYAKKHPDNSRYHDPKMLALAIRIGDLLASENEKGRYEPRLDSDWDTGLWLEAYRLLAPELGEQRRTRWKQEIEKTVTPLIPELTERLDFPWYNSPYIGTSPNHYALWASLIYLAGQVFGKPEWERLGTQVMRRFATVEQTPDGYWGEHSRSGPTTGYNHLTFTALATYWENSQDATVLPALRRATDFHKNYTYPDGVPVEVINDRNRHWEVDAWGHFGFSHFPDGRRYAEFLTGKHEFIGPPVAERALLPRRTHRADPAGSASLLAPDDRPGRDPQNGSVGGLSFRPDQYSSSEQPLLSGPPGPFERLPPEDWADHHGRQFQAPT